MSANDVCVSPAIRKIASRLLEMPWGLAGMGFVCSTWGLQRPRRDCAYLGRELNLGQRTCAGTQSPTEALRLSSGLNKAQECEQILGKGGGAPAPTETVVKPAWCGGSLAVDVFIF